MLRSKAGAILFYFSAVLIGAAAGIAVDRNYIHGRVEKMRDDPRMSRDEFFRSLALTEPQRKTWDSIRTARMRADSVLLVPAMEQMKLVQAQRDSLRNATNAATRALLTPEQLKLWDEQQAKDQARRQRPTDGRR
jgi:hypothetical protein